MKFKTLRINDWKQFQNIDVDFPIRLVPCISNAASPLRSIFHLSIVS